MKESVRRERPLRSDGTRATGFSFPSGTPRRRSPRRRPAAAPGYKAGVPTYLVASYVAMSRLHENVHSRATSCSARARHRRRPHGDVARPQLLRVADVDPEGRRHHC
jgi:hypothetical protein